MEPYRARSCCIPTAPTKGGMTMGTSRSPLKSPLPGNSRRVMTKASGSATTVVMAVTVTPSIRLLTIASRWTGLANISQKKRNEKEPSM